MVEYDRNTLSNPTESLRICVAGVGGAGSNVLDRIAQMAGMVMAWRDDGAAPSATRCTFPRTDRSHRPWGVRGGRSVHAVAR